MQPTDNGPPGWQPAWERASLAFDQGRLDEARRLATELATVAGAEAAAWRLLGRIARRQAWPGAAMDALAKAVQHDPADPLALADLAVAQLDAGLTERAAANLGLAAARAPLLAEAHLARSEAHQRLGRSEPALAALRDACVAAAMRANLSAPTRRFAEGGCRLGRRLAGAGRHADSAAAFAAALELREDCVDGHYGLAIEERRAGRTDAALEHLRRAVALAPQHVGAQLGLGDMLARAGQGEAALACFLAAAAAAPQLATPHARVGEMLRRAGDRIGAILALRRAVGLGGDDPAACRALAEILGETGAIGEALPHARRAVALAADAAWPRLLLGELLERSGDGAAALAEIRAAIAAEPRHGPARQALGRLLLTQGRLAEARAELLAAALLDPFDSGPWLWLGRAAERLGRLPEARAALARAVVIAPNQAAGHVHLGQVLLRRGDWRRGWAHYGWRLADPAVPERGLPRPRWDGGPLAGRRLLVASERYGAGEELLALAAARALVAAGTLVVVECPARLVALARRSAPGIEVVAAEDPPAPRLLASDIALVQPAAGLPGRVWPDGPPTLAPWLVPDAGRVAALAARYRADGGQSRIVGLSWAQGGAVAEPALWAPVLTLPGIRVVNLQPGRQAGEMAAEAARLGIPLIHDREMDPWGDLDDYAARVAACDMVACVDNLTAHMAGGLGVRGLVAVGAGAAWPWGAGAVRTPFYPSLALFPQPTADGWGDVFERLARVLAAG